MPPSTCMSPVHISRVSRRGLIAYASSTDCVGPIASTVADVAALLGVIAGEDPLGDATAIKQPVPDYTAILKQVTHLHSWKSVISWSIAYFVAALSFKVGVSPNGSTT